MTVDWKNKPHRRVSAPQEQHINLPNQDNYVFWRTHNVGELEAWGSDTILVNTVKPSSDTWKSASIRGYKYLLLQT